MWNYCNPYSHKTSKRFSVLPTRQVDLSLGLRNALTKKVWKSVPYRDWATRQAQKGGRGGRETGKGGERQKTEGKGEGNKRAQSPFLSHPFYGLLPRRLTWKRGWMIHQLSTRDCGVFNVPSWCMNWTSRSSAMNLYSSHIWWVWPA